VLNGGGSSDDYLLTDNYFNKKDRISILDYVPECDATNVIVDTVLNEPAAPSADDSALEVNIDDFDIQCVEYERLRRRRRGRRYITVEFFLYNDIG
jgi:hypothetical protein